MSPRALRVWLGVLFLSALALVDVRNHYLMMFSHEQRLVSRRDALQVEWGRLLLEQGTLAGYGRVDHVARKRLGMAMPDPRRIVLLYMRHAHPR